MYAPAMMLRRLSVLSVLSLTALPFASCTSTIDGPNGINGPAEGEGEGEGELIAGEGEGEGDVGAGEGEGDVATGEGEGDVATGEGEGEPPPPPEGDGFCAAQSVFDASCVQCHNGSIAFPDLRAGASQNVIGLASEIRTDLDLVVAGDPGASFLLTKMTAVGANEGDVMPLGGTSSAAQIEAVRAWIAAGASTDCGGPPPPPPPPVELVPGGDVSGNVSGPGNGFGGNQPGESPGSCSTNQWWELGDQESSRMHPGHACLTCHRQENEGPQQGYLGTVQQAVDDSNDCKGINSVRVDILDDSDGSVIATANTNSAGNFIIEQSVVPYRVRLTLDGRTREMLTPQTDGDCMRCHTTSGVFGAPGRIVAP
jgi:hypothetical protein